MELIVRPQMCEKCKQKTGRLETVTIYPHCVICGKEATTQTGGHAFFCDKHWQLWGEFFNKSTPHKKEHWRDTKNRWEEQFKKFLIKYTSKEGE